MAKVNRKAAGPAQERERRFVRYRDAGVPVGDAIRLALAEDPHDREQALRAIPLFAERHGLNSKLAASAIYGGRRATHELLAALATELGGTVEEWKHRLSPRSAAA